MRRLRPLTEDALRAVLTSELHRSGELRFIHRLHAVLLVSVGRSCYEVAGWFGADPRSVERWIHAYEQYGAEGLREQQRSGRPAQLTAQQVQQLGLELAADPDLAGYPQLRWSGKLVAVHLERHYGVLLGERHCQRLMQGLRQ